MENSSDQVGSPPPLPPTAQTVTLPTDRFPETEEEADMAEVLLAKEFEQLSVQEREKILYDIHGVSDVMHEDPNEIERQLLDLESELGNITEGKDAYTRAISLNQAYVTSSSFRLMHTRRFMAGT